MVEWSNTAVLKTADVKASGGSNPSLGVSVIWICIIGKPATGVSVEALEYKWQ